MFKSHSLLALFLGCLAPGAAGIQAAPAALRIALVSGAETYRSDEAFAGLAAYLEKQYGMICEILPFSADGTEIRGLDRLLAADAAVFHVRRKVPRPEDLALLKKFFASGKGFVALRSTSHGWENWKEFDREILGATYGGSGGGNFGNAEKLHFKPHPIWEGAQGLDTKKDLYRLTSLAPDLDVILEGETRNGRIPVAWTRTRGDSRLFYLALFYEIDTEPFRRAVANALFWVTVSSPPSAAHP